MRSDGRKQVQSPKADSRNPKEGRNPNPEKPKHNATAAKPAQGFRTSTFGFRASDFEGAHGA